MDVHVLGVALHPAALRIGDKRLEEVVFDTSHDALDNAGISRAELDHVTIAACDELDGRSISSMLLAAPAGAYLKDEIKVTDSGMIGLCMEALRLSSGRFDLGLVASWNKSSKGPFEDIMRMRCEPFYTRPIGLNMTIADGLFAQAAGEAFGITDDEVCAAVRAGYERAARNPRGLCRAVPAMEEICASPYVAAPLRKAHQAPVTDGAVAIVLASGRWLKKHPEARPIARLSGIGWRTDTYNLGNRRLTGFESLKGSFGAALSMCGAKGFADLDLIELDSQTGYHEAAFRRALGLPNSFTVSPSGGPFAQNPYFCTGLVNAAEAILQVSGRAGTVQVKGARRAAAHGCHGFAQQGNAIAIFEGV